MIDNFCKKEKLLNREFAWLKLEKSRMNKGGKFLKKLWCCVGERV